MAKVFISYKRDVSFSLAKLISEKLKQADIDVFLDVERMDSAGPFPKRLLREIENSDIFICLLANSTLEAPWVQREIEHAHIMQRPMIPVFQDSYVAPTEPLSHYVAGLLEYQGVIVLDKRGLYVDDAIDKLARMVKETTQTETVLPESEMDDVDTEPVEPVLAADDDTTQIGARTFNLRPQQNKSRRWLWLVMAALVVVLGIFLFQWVNTPIINAAVAGTQTAIVIANEATVAHIHQTETQEFIVSQAGSLFTSTPSLTPTDGPTATPMVSPSPTSIVGITLVIDRDSVPIRREPVSNGDIIVIVSNRRLMITGISADRLYYRVDYYGMEAWVGVSYGTVEGDPRYLPVIGAILIIDNSSVPIRRVPAPSGDIIVIVSNRRLMITGISADRLYYRVDYDGTEAWVAISYGMVEGDLTTVSLISDSE